jgi:hypothetical protein
MDVKRWRSKTSGFTDNPFGERQRYVANAGASVRLLTNSAKTCVGVQGRSLLRLNMVELGADSSDKLMQCSEESRVGGNVRAGFRRLRRRRRTSREPLRRSLRA